MSDAKKTPDDAALREFPERLRLALGSKPVHAFARGAGMTDSLLRKYLSATSLPGLDKLLELAKAAGVRLEWLATGEGPMRHGAEPSQLSDLVAVRRYYVRASAGPGRIDEREESVELALPRHLLRGLGVEPARAAVIQAIGDSMTPTIAPGELMLIELRDGEELHDGAIYVFRATGQLFVKRLVSVTDGTFEVKGDNEARSRVFGPKDELVVVGRVAAFIRRV